jgi:hypothetical protein
MGSFVINGLPALAGPARNSCILGVPTSIRTKIRAGTCLTQGQTWHGRRVCSVSSEGGMNPTLQRPETEEAIIRGHLDAPRQRCYGVCRIRFGRRNVDPGVPKRAGARSKGPIVSGRWGWASGRDRFPDTPRFRSNRCANRGEGFIPPALLLNRYNPREPIVANGLAWPTH